MKEIANALHPGGHRNILNGFKIIYKHINNEFYLTLMF